MRITGCTLTPYRLPLTRPWISHYGRVDQRCGWIIHIDSDNHVGIGDCAPLTDAGTESHLEAQTWLHSNLPTLKGENPVLLLEILDHWHPSPAARCGVEMALIDLISREQGASIAHWLSGDRAVHRVDVNANMGGLNASSENDIHQVEGYQVIKVKLGTAAPDQELKWLQRLSAALPSGVRLRLDVNRAWSVLQAERFIDAIAPLPIESIEEPLRSSDPEQLRLLQQGTSIPLSLDESLAQIHWDSLLQHPPVERVTLKPMVHGGLKPCLTLAQQAQQAGMAVVITTTIDSAIGVWGALHLAAALGETDSSIAHGLATSSWLQSDVATPPAIDHGFMSLNLNRSHPIERLAL